MKAAKYAFTVAIVVGLLAFVIVHVLPRGTGAGSPGHGTITQLKENTVVPPFQLTDLDGGTRRLRDYKDRLILVNFWASWCDPCNDEAPSLEKLYRQLGPRGLTVVAISIDHNVSDVKGFVNKYSITFPVLLDTGEDAAAAYGITGVPETFILDGRDRLIKHIVGPLDWTSPEVKGYLSGLLKEEQ